MLLYENWKYEKVVRASNLVTCFANFGAKNVCVSRVCIVG